MAITYFRSGTTDALQWGSPGTVLSGSGCYKDVLVTGCAVGDLLVAVGGAEGNNFSGGSSLVSTQAGPGTTGAWTPTDPSVVVGADTDVVIGRAEVTGAGDITVRVRTTASSPDWMGGGVLKIPAGEWNPSGTFYTQPYVGDADGQANITIGGTGTYTVVYLNTDWNAMGRSGTTFTPGSSTTRTTYNAVGRYSVDVVTWTGQTPATRAYGTTGVPGQDASGVILAIPEAASAGNDRTGTLTASAPASSATVPTASMTGTRTVPVAAGAVAASAPAATVAVPTASLTGSRSVPVYAGSPSASAPAATVGVPTSAWTGTRTVPDITGSVAASAPTSTVGVATSNFSGFSTPPGTVGGPLVANTPTVAVAPPSSAWTGTRTVPVYAGTVARPTPTVTVGTPVATMTGTTVVPVSTGSLSGSTPALTVAVPVVTIGGTFTPQSGANLAASTPTAAVLVPTAGMAGTFSPPRIGTLARTFPPISVGVPTAAWAGNVTELFVPFEWNLISLEGHPFRVAALDPHPFAVESLGGHPFKILDLRSEHGPAPRIP